MLSGKTEAPIIDALATCTYPELDQIFRALELLPLASQHGVNKSDTVVHRFAAIRGNDPNNADRKIIEVAGEWLKRRWKAIPEGWHQEQEKFLFANQELLGALRVEGWKFEDGRLVPETPMPLSLASEVSALERDLTRLGFDVALRHYQQALENYTAGNAESTGGQCRSFLEDLYMALCTRRAGKKIDDAVGAIQHLHQKQVIEKGEFDLARGFFDWVQSRGAHAGLSSHDEARFRIHFATALGAYLIARLSKND